MAEEITPDLQGADNQEQRPEWLPEKFADGQALAKSYRELESKLGELSERAKYAESLEENYNALAAQVEQLQARQTQTQQTDYVSQLEAQLQQARDMGDTRAELAIWTNLQTAIADDRVNQRLQATLPQVQQQYQTLADSQAEEISVYAARTLEQRYGQQFEQARDAMAQILEANPHLVPDEAKYNPSAAISALDNVFRLATYGAQPEPQAPSDEQKRLAQTATGSGTRVLSPDEQKQEWDAIRAAGDRPYWAGLPQ